MMKPCKKNWSVQLCNFSANLFSSKAVRNCSAVRLTVNIYWRC